MSIEIKLATAADDWPFLSDHDEEGDTYDAPVSTPCLVSLKTWNKNYALFTGQQVGVLLTTDARLETLLGEVKSLPMVAIHFARFADGRGYTLAHRLRKQYGYQGKLRATGDVLNDQLFMLSRVGFDSLVLRADQDLSVASARLRDFSVCYQTSADQTLPLFKRVARGSV